MTKLWQKEIILIQFVFSCDSDVIKIVSERIVRVYVIFKSEVSSVLAYSFCEIIILSLLRVVANTIHVVSLASVAKTRNKQQRVRLSLSFD